MRRWWVTAGGVAAALVIVLVYVVGVHQPQRAEIADLDSDTRRLREQRLLLQRDIKGLEDVSSRQAEFRSALALLEGLVPDRLAQPVLLAQLQDAAEAAGVELVSVTFGEPEVPTGAPPSHVQGTVLVAMPVTVVVDGPFLRITDLLRRVEADLERAVLVGSVAFAEAEAGFPQLRGTWSGEAYALMRADDPLLVDATAPPATPPTSSAPAQGRP